MNQELEHLRFPIGHFEPVILPTAEERANFMNQIPELNATLRNTLHNLQPDQLQTPYRLQGWTIEQIVHHLADNDMNAYLRFKRALTEHEPVASSYREDLWAELHDYKNIPIENSLQLHELLHIRFMILLQGLNPEDFNRTFRTQVLGVITMDTGLQRFIWHNRHHISQIKSLIDRKGW